MSPILTWRARQVGVRPVRVQGMRSGVVTAKQSWWMNTSPKGFTRKAQLRQAPMSASPEANGARRVSLAAEVPLYLVIQLLALGVCVVTFLIASQGQSRARTRGGKR